MLPGITLKVLDGGKIGLELLGQVREDVDVHRVVLGRCDYYLGLKIWFSGVKILRILCRSSWQEGGEKSSSRPPPSTSSAGRSRFLGTLEFMFRSLGAYSEGVGTTITWEFLMKLQHLLLLMLELSTIADDSFDEKDTDRLTYCRWQTWEQVSCTQNVGHPERGRTFCRWEKVLLFLS